MTPAVPRWILLLLAPLPLPGLAAGQTTADFLVRTTSDAGEGSLRDAITRANAASGRRTIRFDSTHGPFAEARTIVLKTVLPALRGDVVIDGYIEGRLWTRTGVTVSGAGRRHVFRVAPGARARIESLTVAEGRAAQGGGILNEGKLVVKNVTFLRNVAEREGGAVASLGGELVVVNSTFVDNDGRVAGGGLAHLGGKATVTNCTFSANRSARGGALFTKGGLLLRNAILANSREGRDCVAESAVDARSTHNLVMANEGCGTPISTADPRFERLAAYNGPTPTLPLGGGSPATNLGDNASAVDEDGRALVWDQRGNGDPRFVAGFADLGAFEVQAFPVLKVNTLEDNGLRGCSGAGNGDCPLRGAIELANASKTAQVIRFDPALFQGTTRTIAVARPLPDATVDVILDAGASATITVLAPGDGLRAAPGRKVTLRGVKVEGR
jgi:predicted outer membrane repeat protein